MQKFTTYKPTFKLLPFVKRTLDVFELPTSWSELDSEQFVRIAAVLFDNRAENKIKELRLLCLQAITGYERSNQTFTEDMAEQINCNLYILSQCIRFPFKMVFKNPDLISNLSDELQKAVKDYFLFEIYEPELQAELKKYGGLLEYGIELNPNLTSNLLPSITIDGITYNGPRFGINEDGVLDTDLLAGEWIDANDYMNFMAQSRKEKYLANVAACLYRQDRKNYSTSDAQERAEIFAKARPEELKAVWLLVKSMQEYFFNDLNFNVLYSKREKGLQSNKIEVGSSNILYQLSKDGYGSLSEVANMLVTDFLSIQLKNISDAISALRSMGKNPSDIAKAYKMDINTVLKFI